jgi:hypothetical protein
MSILNLIFFKQLKKVDKIEQFLVELYNRR